MSRQPLQSLSDRLQPLRLTGRHEIRLHHEEIRRQGTLAGFTLTELMVGLVIGGVILSTAVILMSGYLPRARLNREAERVRIFLVQAQERAKDEQRSFCYVVRRNTTPHQIFLYRNSNDYLCANAGDTLVETFTLSEDVTVADCSSEQIINTSDWHLLIMQKGSLFIYDAPGDGLMPYFMNQNLVDLHLVLRSSRLDLQIRARSIYIRAGKGTIDLLPPAPEYEVNGYYDSDRMCN